MDSLSGVLGWVSIACWIVVYSPQIYENYSLQSGEGLSVLFVVIWLLGDTCNLIGAVIGHLMPTVVLLGLYYSACDLILLGQIYYYRWKRHQPPSGEQESLLNRNDRETISTTCQLVQYIAALIFVFVVGVAAWWVGETTEVQDPPPQSDEPWWGVQVLGWASAILYLGARLPQISKNFKTRCEGLSPALFFFAIFGNATYSLSICAKSIDSEYLILNAGWLAGSTFTVFVDAFVVCQIFYYRKVDGSSQPLIDVN